MLSLARLQIMRLALALCAFGATACPTQTQLVGDAVVRINLDECYGAGTSCASSSVVPRPIEAPAELTCELDAALEGEVGWTVTSALEMTTAAVAPDDALWVGSALQGYSIEEPNEVVIERFDARGERSWMMETDLGADHDFRNVFVTSIAFDGSGHGFVVVEGMVTDREDGWAPVPVAWLLEITAEGELIGDPIAIEGGGGVKVASADDGSLLLSASSYVDKRSVLGRLNADRTVAWIQTSLRQNGVHQVVADEAGGAFVFGRSAAEELFSFDDSLALYDASGNLLWDVHPGTEMSSIVFGSLVRASEGSVVGVGALPDMPVDAIAEDVFVFKVSSSGETAWSVRLVDTLLNPDTASIREPGIDGEDNVYVSTRGDEGTSLFLYRIDADGTHCSKVELDEVAALAPGGANLIFAPSGKVYFSAMGPGGQPTTFGVFER